MLFEGVSTLLTELRAKGTRLGVITNGSELSQKAKLLNSGIADLIDHYLISGVFGKHKPDPDIFTSMLESLDTKADECVFIGDNPRADILGAQMSACNRFGFQRNNLGPTMLRLSMIGKSIT